MWGLVGFQATIHNTMLNVGFCQVLNSHINKCENTTNYYTLTHARKEMSGFVRFSTVRKKRVFSLFALCSFRLFLVVRSLFVGFFSCFALASFGIFSRLPHGFILVFLGVRSGFVRLFALIGHRKII